MRRAATYRELPLQHHARPTTTPGRAPPTGSDVLTIHAPQPHRNDMSRKTSQLQIRISPDQKATLKRLAAEAGVNVSQYVLRTVLPSTEAEMARHAEALGPRSGRGRAFADLRKYLSDLPLERFTEAAQAFSSDDWPTVIRHHVAAAVEECAARHAARAPRWTRELAPLDRPHFSWEARSLRPHLMRITPVFLKRRDVFRDADGIEGGPTVPEFAPRDPSLPTTALERLADQLSRTGASAELCVVGDRVVPLLFQRRPDTRNVTALFADQDVLTSSVAEIGAREGLPDGWVDVAARGAVGAPGDIAWLEFASLRVFRPTPSYLFAMLCASARRTDVADVQDGLRATGRLMGVHTVPEALEVAHRYFTPRQLPNGLEALLWEVVGS